MRGIIGKMAATMQRILYVSYRRTTSMTDIKITIKNPSGSVVVNAQVMTEDANGDYIYEYVPAVAGYHTWYANSDTASLSAPDSGTFLSDYVSGPSFPSAADGDYISTAQLARSLNILAQIPSLKPAGSARDKELIGTGDDSNTLFYFDHSNVIAGSYTLYHGATESAAIANPLTETTHYTVDLDTGTITLTSAGVTKVSTDKIYSGYSFVTVDLTNTQLQEVIDRAQNELEGKCGTVWVDVTAATPAWGVVSDELHDGKGLVEPNYWARKGPIPLTITTQLTQDEAADTSTLHVDSTNGFPSSGVINIDSDKISYTGKTSTTFTGCTGTDSAHLDNAVVYPYVIEISTTSSGGTVTWTVLKNTKEAFVSNTGRIFLHARGVDITDAQIGTISYPLRNIAGRCRLSYIFGYEEVTEELQDVMVMLASKKLIKSSLRHALITGSSVEGRAEYNVDDAEIKQFIEDHKIYISSIP